MPEGPKGFGQKEQQYAEMENDLVKNVVPKADAALKKVIQGGEAMFHGDSSKPAIWINVPEGTTSEQMQQFVTDTNEALAEQGRSIESLHGMSDPIKGDDGVDRYEYEVKEG